MSIRRRQCFLFMKLKSFFEKSLVPKEKNTREERLQLSRPILSTNTNKMFAFGIDDATQNNELWLVSWVS